MATELEQLEALDKAGIASAEQKARLLQLKVGATATVNTEGMEVLGMVTDVDRFNSAGEYGLAKEGFYKSAIVSIQEPVNTKSVQKWLIVETADELKSKTGAMRKNRGVLVLTFDAGVGITRTALDGLGIAYKLDENTGNLFWARPKLPYVFYGEWGSDPKAIGQVKISGLKTEAIGAAIKPTV